MEWLFLFWRSGPLAIFPFCFFSIFSISYLSHPVWRRCPFPLFASFRFFRLLVFSSLFLNFEFLAFRVLEVWRLGGRIILLFAFSHFAFFDVPHGTFFLMGFDISHHNLMRG